MYSFELPEVTDECEDVSHRCLVGKILAPKILHKPAVTKILLTAWKPRASVSITPWKENLYLFQFDDLEDRSRVLLEAPWSVMGSLLVLQTLQPGMAAEDLDFRWSPFWVQIHGLPFGKMTRAHGEVIGNRIGRLVEAEAPSDGLLLHRSFLRLRIEVDVTKPLLQGFILYRCDCSGPVGDGVKVYYKYEKLTEFCYDCGRIGHDNLSCKFVSREDGRNSGYGPHQRTGPARSVTSPRSPNERPMEELRAAQDQSMHPLSIPIGAAAARSNRGDGVGVSGSAAPSSQNLDETVEVQSVRNRVVELGAAEFSQTVVPRPCTTGSPLVPSYLLDPSSHASTLDSGSSHRHNLDPGPVEVVGSDHPHLGPLMASSVLKPNASYFVTEPFEAVSSFPQPTTTMPYPTLCVEELSPSPSPERPRPTTSLIETRISQEFTSLSLKRQLSEEELCEHVPLKKWKEADSDINNAVVDSKALCVLTRKPKPRAISRRGSRLKKVPLVDIPIQNIHTAVIPNPRGVVPVDVVSLTDNDCCTTVFGLLSNSAVDEADTIGKNQRVVVADPKQAQDSY
ncbi:hypothetical protein ACSBR1_002812 [Camellia fascicularis]